MRRNRPRELRELARVHGAGWLMPPSPLAPDVPPGDAEWLTARRMPQPLRTFEEPIRLTGAAPALPRSLHLLHAEAARRRLRPIRRGARGKRDGWRYREIDSGHTPNVTAPLALAAILEDIVSK